MALAIDRCKSSKSALDRTSRNFALELLLLELEGFERFIVNFIKRRDSVIPLKQCGGGTDSLDRVAIHLPNRVQNRVIVGVEDVLFEFGMARNVDLSDPMVRNVI